MLKGCKKNFGRYWVTGLIFAIVYEAVSIVIGWIQEYLISKSS